MRRTTALLLSVIVVLLPVATNLATSIVPRVLSPYLWIAWPTMVVLAAVVGTVEYRGRLGRACTATQEPSRRPEAMLRQLREAVREQWHDEVTIRGFNRPNSVSVRWATTRRPVAAAAAAVLGATSRPSTTSPPRLGGHLAQLADAVLRLPRRQLVLLGDAGAGKSVAMMRLTLDLLDRCPPEGPVPVLLALSSWNPATEELTDWIARRISEDYPALANTRLYGEDPIGGLVNGNKLFLLLDGLDELHGAERAAAIERLDVACAGGRPLVVACRGDDYQGTVTRTGVYLATAAVVEIEPMTVQQIISYLRLSRPAAETRWAPVEAHLRANADGILAQTLSTPLMLWLAQTTYQGDRNPANLLNPGLLTRGRDALIDHLLDGYLSAVYAGRGRDRYGHEQANRWLTFLAEHMHRQPDPHSLAWWSLHAGMSPRVRSATTSVVVGTAAAVVGGIVGSLADRPMFGLELAVLLAIIAGTGAAIASHIAGPVGRPRRIDTRARGRFPQVIRALADHAPRGLLVGAIVGTISGLVDGTGTGLRWGVTFALGVAFVAALYEDRDSVHATNPVSAMRGDKAAACLNGLIFAVGYVAVTNLVFRTLTRLDVFQGSTWGLLFVIALGFLIGLTAGLLKFAWGGFVVARWYHAARRDLPLDLLSFLRDAHRRGVLRQTGAHYQFRHERLRLRLLSRSSIPTVDVPPRSL